MDKINEYFVCFRINTKMTNNLRINNKMVQNKKDDLSKKKN